MHPEREFDLIIVGGGLAGASLAAALGDSSLRIAVVERWPIHDDNQPSYDERTVALTWSARTIYTGMGVWQDIAGEAEPILDIHVSNRGGFGMAHLSHRDAGTPALGYVVPTRTIGRVLGRAIDTAANVTLFCPAEAGELARAGERQVLGVTLDGERFGLTAPLVVVADGGRSGLLADTRADITPYEQRALLSIVTSDRAHGGRAWERFTEEGPLALLPLSGNRLAVVWTSMPEALEARQAMDDEAFIHHLQDAFGHRAGRFSAPSPRKSYPLSRGHIDEPAADRTVVLGNAAHIVHPVAGQGFNLGLRDVATLAQLVFEADRDGRDIGDDDLLRRYNDLRRRDTRMVRRFTHGLITLFASGRAPVSLLRNLGLQGVEMLPPVKRFLLRRTMGMADTRGRLARGLPLSQAAE